MKKIIYISSSTFPSTKANSVQVMKMCEQFGFTNELHLYGIRNNSTNESNIDLHEYYGCDKNFKISLVNHNSNLIYSSIIFFKLLFNTSDIYYSRNFLIACLLKIICKKNVVFEVHVDPQFGPFYNKIFKPILKYTNLKVVAISSKLKQIFVDYYHFKPDKVLVAHDAADPKKINSSFQELNPENINVGYIGSLYEGRGLEIVCQLAKLNDSIKFNIIGGSDNEINSLKIKYSYANLIFHGHVPYNEVPDYIKQQNILLAPYQKNLKVAGGVINTMEYMSPLKIFEYMASKRPMIISNLEIIHEVLDSKTAMFADPENIIDWNKALNELINNKILYREISSASYSLFIEKYTVEERVNSIIDFIKK
jgi:glycosyltransferase involved in cell wall biosynthesis